MVLSYFYFNMGEVQKAKSLIEEAIALDKKIKYASHTPYAMWALGCGYRWLGEWDKSFQYLTKAFELAEEVGEYQTSGSAALELGELYMGMENYVEAEKYLKRSSEIYEKEEINTAKLIRFQPFQDYT